MYTPAITGTGIFTPEDTISNTELMKSFNAYADKFNLEHADQIETGEVAAQPQSSEEFIVKSFGIYILYIIDKYCILYPDVMHSMLR